MNTELKKAKCVIKICMLNEGGGAKGLLQFGMKAKYENVATGVLRVKVLCVAYRLSAQKAFFVEY